MGTQEILLETGTNEFEILEFYINEKSTEGTIINYFGMNVAKVMEVIESPNLENKDYAVNPCFLGTIGLRDLILPVIDLSIWLGMERETHDHENIIVTQFSNTIQGFLVSGVVEIHRHNWKDLIPPGEFIRKMNTQSITGLIEKEDHFIQLLDMEHIVSDLNPKSIEELWKSEVTAKKNYHALIAEDSPTIQKILEKNLIASNFQVSIVNNGEEAISFLMKQNQNAIDEGKKIEDVIDIVISDIEMPLVDGFTLTKTIKQTPEFENLPVILYSSIITDELRHKGESVKADFQVSKPDLNQMASKAISLIER